jgi:prolyl 4-hydroxylase
MVWVDAKGEGEEGGGEGADGGGDGLEGGGTEFPLLKRARDARWCAFVECADDEWSGGGDDAEAGNGTVFKPVPGNAVYWENFRADTTGRGYEETWHAGLPVKKGVKVGLNIWSWGWIE